MDYAKIKEYIDLFLSLLTKLLAGFGVIDDADNPPYGEYIKDFEAIADAVVGSQD